MQPPYSQQFSITPHQPSPGKPVGLKIYFWYCILSSFFMMAYVVFGGCMIVFSEEMARTDPDVDDPIIFVVMGSAFLFMVIPALLYLSGIFFQQGKFAWYYGMVLLCLGTVCGCMPFAVAGIVLWLQRETKAYFGLN